MNFASSMPVSRAGFEGFVYQYLGANVTVEAVIAVSAVVAITLIFKSSLISSGLR